MNPTLFSLEIATASLAIMILLADLFLPQIKKSHLGYLAAVGLVLVFASSFYLSLGEWGGASHPMFLLDPFALFFKRLFLVAGMIVCLMSVEFAGQMESGVGEFFALILCALTGMLLVASTNDFILLFVSLELITVTFYVLTSYLRRNILSLEAGVKYLILGALSSALLVYGIAFVFGTTGTTNFSQISGGLAGHSYDKLFVLGLSLVMAGLSFKVAAVPFQVWVPDVYEGAPTPVSAFLAVGSKMAGFVLLLRIVFGVLNPLQERWKLLIAILAAATILYGNLGAIPQRNLKRLLGYSSIGHAGFLLMGVTAGSSLGVRAVLFYLLAYLFANLGAFLIVVLVSNAMGYDDVDAYRGLAQRSPLLAWVMAVAMTSLAGIPPLAGFFGKFLVFSAVIEQKMYWLVVVGLVGVGASLYFYLGIVRVMFWGEAVSSGAIPVSRPLRIVLWVIMGATILIGVYQGPFLQAAMTASDALRFR